MKIYLLRHGETDLNKDKRMSCSDQAKINETGIAQAEEASKVLENINYDLMISSPYMRTKITAEIANKDRVPIMVDDRLRERNAGVLEGKPLAEFTKIEMAEFFDYYKNVEYEGAENIKDFCKRVWEFLEEIKEKYKDKSIVLVTHNIVIRAIKAYVIGMPEDGNIGIYGIGNGVIEEYILE